MITGRMFVPSVIRLFSPLKPLVFEHLKFLRMLTKARTDEREAL